MHARTHAVLSALKERFTVKDTATLLTECKTRLLSDLWLVVQHTLSITATFSVLQPDPIFTRIYASMYPSIKMNESSCVNTDTSDSHSKWQFTICAAETIRARKLIIRNKNIKYHPKFTVDQYCCDWKIFFSRKPIK